MKRLVIISFFICLLSAFSCSPNESMEGTSPVSSRKLVLSTDKNYAPHKVKDALKGDYGKYLGFFKNTDYMVGISSHVDGARSSVEKIAFYSGECHYNTETRASSRELPMLFSSIDGIDLNQKNLESYIPTRGNGTLDVFGKTVSFKVRTSSVAQTRSVDDMSVDDGFEDFEMYIPERISILAPAATNAEENNPLCYYGDFVIRWNADELNANGVLVYVEWLGGMVLGNDINDTCVQRVAVVPDTGEARLDPSLFDGIPDTALCSLFVLRGALENVQGQEYSFKLIGETHHMIPFILIREIQSM